MQEKAKEEHIRQAEEKALEEQRELEEKRNRDIERQRKETEAINQARERDRENGTVSNDYNPQNTTNTEVEIQTPETSQPNTSTTVGNDWSQVSPEQASSYMSAKTGVSASTWLDVIYKESSGNPYITNPIGYYGLLQINQSVHGQVSNLSPQDYLDKAVSIYQGSGGTAWDTW